MERALAFPNDRCQGRASRAAQRSQTLDFGHPGSRFLLFLSKNLFDSPRILLGVDADGVAGGVQHRHGHSRREGAELLEALGALERMGREARPAPQRVLAVAVKPEMLERRE